MASPAGAGAPGRGRGGWLLSPVGKRGSVSGARVVVGAGREGGLRRGLRRGPRRGSPCSSRRLVDEHVQLHPAQAVQLVAADEVPVAGRRQRHRRVAVAPGQDRARRAAVLEPGLVDLVQGVVRGVLEHWIKERSTP